MGTSISSHHQISVHKNPTPTQFLEECSKMQAHEPCQTKGVWPFFEVQIFRLVTLNERRKHSVTFGKLSRTFLHATASIDGGTMAQYRT